MDCWPDALVPEDLQYGPAISLRKAAEGLLGRVVTTAGSIPTSKGALTMFWVIMTVLFPCMRDAKFVKDVGIITCKVGDDYIGGVDRAYGSRE